MVDVLSIADLILSHAGDMSSLLMVTCVIAAIAISVAEYKDKIPTYILNRRNKWWFAYLALTLAVIVFLRLNSRLSGCWLITVSALWALYGMECFFSLKPKRFMNYRNPVLRRYEKWLNNGSSIEHIDFFRKPHWYLFTAEDKLEFYMLGSSYFADAKEFDAGYKVLDKIKEDWLYEEEKEILKLQRAMLLTQMGSVKAAYQLLGNPEKNTSSNPMTWFAYSFIFENGGDIDKALMYSEKSRDIVEAGYKAPDFIIAEIYNNYSRVAMFKGNRQEALHYLDAAWERVKKSKDMRVLHIVASNRIAQMAMAGKSQSDCETALKEYRSLIPNDSFMNIVEYNNCEISYYRQIKDSEKENALIKSGFKEVIGHLNRNQKAIYIASTFGILMNGHFDYKWLDNFINAGSKEYDDLPLMDKLVVYKEYTGFFQQEVFRAVCNKRPYSELQKTIMKYYREQAIADVDEILKGVEPCNRFKYMYLMTMKLGILKLVEGKKHIDQSKGIYVDLYHQLYDAGLHLDAVRVLMTLIAECSSAYNILIRSPLWNGAMYYSDYIAGAPPAPEPQLAPDGIHLQYARLQVPIPFVVCPLKDNIIREHIDKVIEEFRSWKNHPYKVELSVEIAHILVCIDRREEAKEFLLFFKDSGVSERHMSSWAREEAEALSIELNMQEAQLYGGVERTGYEAKQSQA